MTKRSAASELNQDNWDREEEKVEAGTFQQSTPEILQNRIFKTAKRRSTPGNSINPFASFAGFSGSSPASSLSFLSQKPLANNDTKDGSSPSNPSLNSVKPFENIFKKADSPKSDKVEKNDKDLQLLKDLNVSCSKWITEHVQKNPFCILTPVFRDYEKHLSKLNLDINNAEENNASKTNQDDTPVKVINDQKPLNSITNSQKTEFKMPVFGIPTSSTTTTLSSGFSFANTVASQFSFGKELSKPAEQEKSKDGDEETEGEKYELKRVVEDDSLFSIRCKVFVKKESDYVSRGIGMLYLKKVQDNKVQLLVRADTNLGNILLNVLLTPSLPIQKTGNNNIMLICLPTPDSKPPPTTVLIRVKTSEECDNAIKKMEECRGS